MQVMHEEGGAEQTVNLPVSADAVPSGDKAQQTLCCMLPSVVTLDTVSLQRLCRDCAVL